MSEDQFKELLTQIARLAEAVKAQSGRFDKVDERLDHIDEHLDRVDTRLGHLEKEVSGLRTDMEARFAEVRADIHMAYDSAKEVLEQQDTEVKERVHTAIVLKRHERWITGLAKHADLKLSHH